MAAVTRGRGAGMVGPPPAAYAADIAPPEMRGVTMGLYRTFGDAGFVIGPVLLGSLADLTTFGWALTFDAAVLVGIALLFALFAPGAPRRAPAARAPRGGRRPPRLYYEVHGEGVPLVLSHGGWTDTNHWLPNAGRLSRRWRVVLWDRRGCGRPSGS